ncbi:unnamed protein product [Choristocarpus tenellus]
MAAFKEIHQRFPMVLNSAVGYLVFAGGDMMAQQLEKVDAETEWDSRRSLSIGLLGIWQNGVLLHFWYRALDRFVSPKVDVASVLKKIACDEAVFAPQLACSYLATSAYISSSTSGNSVEDRWRAVRQNVLDKALTTWSNDLKLWPAANFIGFTFIPRNVRPIYASAVQLAWQCYLSKVGFSPPNDLKTDSGGDLGTTGDGFIT